MKDKAELVVFSIILCVSIFLLVLTGIEALREYKKAFLMQIKEEIKCADQLLAKHKENKDE